MGWNFVANLMGPQGPVGDWARGALTASNNLDTLLTEGKWAIQSASIAAAVGSPVAPFAVVEVLKVGASTIQRVAGTDGDPRKFERGTTAGGAAWGEWRRTDKDTKKVLHQLSHAGNNALNEVAPARHVRRPLKLAAQADGFRLYLRNYNDQYDTNYGDITFVGSVWFGKRAKDTSGVYTDDFESDPIDLGAPVRTTLTDGSYRWAVSTKYITIEANTEYLISYGYTTPAGQVTHVGNGGAYLGVQPGTAYYKDVSGMSWSATAPLDVYLTLLVDEDTPTYGYLGSSTAAGVNTDDPVRDSFAYRHAYAEGALPVVLAHSGSAMTSWMSTSAWKWQKARAYDRLDRLYFNIGSNDVYGSATLEDLQARNNAVAAVVRSQVADQLFYVNIAPRLAEAADLKAKRLAYNQWLDGLPNGALATYDVASVVTGPDGSLAPIYNSGDGVHLNNLGQAKTAEALIKAGGAQGTPGPAGDGVPAGGTALQLLRKNSTGTTTEWATPTKALVGLGNVDNTADTDKPVSTAQAAAIADTATVVLAGAPSGVDDTASLNAKLAVGAGKTVTLRPGATYKINDTLTVPTGTTFDLNGATIDATGIPAGTALGQRIAIKSEGSLGADLPVTTAVTQWSRAVAGISSTAGLVAGDLILISNDESPVPGMTRTDRDKGELNVIQSVDSATQITLVAGALFAYGTTGLTVQKLTPTENVAIKGGRILLGGIASGHNGIQIRYGRNITIRDVITDGAEDIAVGLNTVWNGKVQSCTIKNSTSSATLGNTGYGIAVMEGSRHVIVKDNNFDNCRHFVAGGGYWPAAFVDVSNNQGQRSLDAAYDCHEPCFYWTFTKNTATSVAAGFILRGQYITADGNEVTDSTGRAYRAATFDGVTEQRGIRIINNKARQCAFGIEVDGQAAGAEPNCLKIDLEVSGNTLRNAGLNPILVRHFDGAEVSGNKVLGSTGHAILLLGLAATQSKNLTANDNTVRLAALDAIKVQYVDDVKIATPDIAAPGNYGIELLNCNRTTTTAPGIRAPGFSGMSISGGALHSVANPMISGGVGATYDGIRVTGTSDLTVVGGYVASARWAVYTTTTDYVVITGVNARGAVSGAKISCDATNKVVANNLV